MVKKNFRANKDQRNRISKKNQHRNTCRDRGAGYSQVH